MIAITEEMIESALLGGALLGGGGGGDMATGRTLARLAVEAGSPRLAALDEFSAEAVLVTVSAVGAPAAKDRYVKPVHYVRAVELLMDAGISIDGLITCENGGLATVNGWFQSAVLGIPVVDAPANGRAHPIGAMGSMGLHRDPEYLSRQAAVGGSPEAGRYVELMVSAALGEAADLVRRAAISAGGLAAAARNPVSVAQARNVTAAGAIRQAVGLGDAMRAAGKTGNAAQAAAAFLGGSILAEGSVTSVSLETVGGFDVGGVIVSRGGNEYQLTFWNEYMTLERNNERLATFPDLIATLGIPDGEPLPTAEIREGMDVTILTVPADRIHLGGGMKDPELYQRIEGIIKKEIVRFAFSQRR